MGKPTHFRPSNENVSACGIECPDYAAYDPRDVNCYSCKSSPEYRAKQREIRNKKGIMVASELGFVINEFADKLASLPHPMLFTDRKTGNPLTALDWARWMFNNCGISGKSAVLKKIKAIVGA